MKVGVVMGRYRAEFLFGLAILLTWFAYSHLSTVVTGVVDLVHYVESAWAILDAATVRERIDALFNWAPIFPSLLAVIIYGAGPEWIYWINPVITSLLIFLIGAWTWHISGQFIAGIFSVLSAATLFFAAYELNAYFMLYPFREPLSFLLIWASLYLAIHASGYAGQKALVRWFLSGLCCVLAAATREPSILALSGPLVFAIVTRQAGRWDKLLRVASLLTPLLMALIALGVFFLFTGVVGSRQFSGWRAMSSLIKLSDWHGMLLQYMSWWHRMLGWEGEALAALGAVSLAWRRPSALLLLLVPMVGTLIFYAGFVVAPRYALSSLLYVLPMVGIGFDHVLGYAKKWLFPKTRWAVWFLGGVLASVLIVQIVSELSRLDAGVRVSRKEMRHFTRKLGRMVDLSRPITTDYRARHLTDALAVHLRQPRPDPNRFASMVDAQGEGYFLKPIATESFTTANVPFPAVRMEDEIAFRQDLLPLQLSPGQDVIHLGPGVYQVFRVVPWTNHVVTQRILPQYNPDALIWIDFKTSDPSADRTVEWLGPNRSLLARWTIREGNGLLPLFAGEAKRFTSGSFLRVTSSAVLPRRLLARPGLVAGVKVFGLGDGRLPSLNQWTDGPRLGGTTAKWGAVFHDHIRFRLPCPVPPEHERGQQPHAMIVLEPRLENAEAPVVFRYSDQRDVLTAATNIMQGGLIYHDVPMAICRENQSACVFDLVVDPHERAEGYFRVVYVGLYYPEVSP